MSYFSSAAAESAGNLWGFTTRDPEPDLDDFGDEPDGTDSDADNEEGDSSRDYERSSRPVYRAPLVELAQTRPASAVVKEAWAEVSALDPELFGRWTERPGRRGRQPSARMIGVPEGVFRAEVLRRVLKGGLQNVSAVVKLESLTKDQPELDFTYLDHGDAQTVSGLIVDNGENFRKALRWTELLGDCYACAKLECSDLGSNKQRQRRQFLRVVWTELDVLSDPTRLSADSEEVANQLEAIVASLNEKVRGAQVRQLLGSPSVRCRVLAALETWTPVPDDIWHTGTDALRTWANNVVLASEAQAYDSIGALSNGLPNGLSQNELNAYLVSLARDNLVHTESTSALRCKPSIDSKAHASQDHLSAAPLNQALYQRLLPIFRNGSPLGVDHKSLPGQLEAEGRRCATWIGVESDLARLSLVLGFHVIIVIETILSSWSVAVMPKESLCRRVANSARRFASLRVEFSPSHAITGRNSMIYRKVIDGMETEYMRRLWRALHRREFTGVMATLDLPTITATLTDTMLTITSWVHESCKAERRGARPVAHPAQPLVSYLSGYLHEAPPAPDDCAAEAARAIEKYLKEKPPASRKRHVSARTRSKEMNHADLASLATTAVATILSCCKASADLEELRGQATYADILDFILGM